MPDDMDEILAAIQERCDKATKGPWILGGCSGRMITTPSGYVGDGFLADFDTQDNAEFSAHARDDVPRLLAWGRVMRKELQDRLATWPHDKALARAEEALRGENG